MEPSQGRRSRPAFLISQLGAYAAARFAERISTLGLSPSDAGIIRVLSQDNTLSQKALADRLGAVPSRVVVLIDSLEKRGLVERVRSSTDRRTYELRLTDAGHDLMRALGPLARAHEDDLLWPLDPHQREELTGLLRLLTDAHGVDPEVHQGYRH